MDKIKIDCRNDMVISGTLLALQGDTITYTSRKTQQQVTARRHVLILSTSYGPILCRCFADDLKVDEVVSQLKVGETYTLPITSYSIENGVKSASVRLI